jgi:DNA (cytosine-5)-methyltransferase 1
MMRVNIPIVSLFCGCGGMDYGLKRKGFIPIIAIDNNEIATKTYNKNNKLQVATVSDISKLPGTKIISMIENLDKKIVPRGVVSGPPCQPFSMSNVHHNPEDSRRSLPLKFASILKVLNEKYCLDFFLFENVVGLKSKKYSSVFNSLTKALTDAGFNLFIEELNAKYFGVAQSRKRLFIVGINKVLYPTISFQFPKGDENLVSTVRDVIGNLPEPVYYSRDLSPSGIPFHQNHWTMNPKSKKFKNSNNSQNGRSFRKLEWDKPSSTIAFGHREINVHPDGHRRLSIFEAMRIQGLPASFKILGNFTQQVSQVSDTLPPHVASAIGKSIRKTIYLPQARISNKLIKWYNENHRDFPWRNTNDPYSILIAEKLLQQTSASENVVKAYNALISRYPDIRSLSCAEPNDLAPIIATLGFRYRACELVKLAKTITERYGGTIPDKLNQLLELPGIGEYIARALLCFAYEYDVPIVDTNIARFIYRIFGWQGSIPSNPARVRRLIMQVNKLMISGKAKIITLAMLDLCSSICSIKEPACLICPISKECQYYRMSRRV